ncbi:MAG: hypothetical protein FH758_12640 [Firmicutes bacterium]|nr:hypothetical protein [Bacillota bacterium]
MSFIKGIERNQKMMFPVYLEDYISEQNTVAFSITFIIWSFDCTAVIFVNISSVKLLIISSNSIVLPVNSFSGILKIGKSPIGKTKLQIPSNSLFDLLYNTYLLSH